MIALDSPTMSGPVMNTQGYLQSTQKVEELGKDCHVLD